MLLQVHPIAKWYCTFQTVFKKNTLKISVQSWDNIMNIDCRRQKHEHPMSKTRWEPMIAFGEESKMLLHIPKKWKRECAFWTPAIFDTVGINISRDPAPGAGGAWQSTTSPTRRQTMEQEHIYINFVYTLHKSENNNTHSEQNKYSGIIIANIVTRQGKIWATKR